MDESTKLGTPRARGCARRCAGGRWGRSAAGPAQAEPLDRNLTQIGADTAWAEGVTGAGTTVAVLDTGVDGTHPDLAGQVVGEQNFSDAADAVDRAGHGTHVAGTIAGTGAAAGGARRGVAPDADLLSGKVLDDFGFGSDSTVIAGMEWAAPQADVVNMSLGAPTQGSGPDPVVEAVDRLSVSLRVDAREVGGGRIEQTLIDAYVG